MFLILIIWAIFSPILNIKMFTNLLIIFIKFYKFLCHFIILFTCYIFFLYIFTRLIVFMAFQLIPFSYQMLAILFRQLFENNEILVFIWLFNILIKWKWLFRLVIINLAANCLIFTVLLQTCKTLRMRIWFLILQLRFICIDHFIMITPFNF